MVLLTLREAALACDSFPKWPGTRLPGPANFNTISLPSLLSFLQHHRQLTTNLFQTSSQAVEISTTELGRILVWRPSIFAGIEPSICQYQNIHSPLEHHSATSPNRKFSTSTLPPLPEVLHTSTISCSQEASIQREQSCLHVRSCQGSF